MKNAIAEYLAEIGRRGGSATSPEKAAASRENGRRGGRPRKADRKPAKKKKAAQRAA